MAKTLCAVLLLSCLLPGKSADNTIAKVREVQDGYIPENEEDVPSGVDIIQTVQSSDYNVQGSAGLEWLSAVTAQRGYKVEGVSSNCQNDMDIYWKGLETGEDWASKIYDAGGRYASQYLYGNNYWLGSKSLCFEVHPPSFNVSFRVINLLVSIAASPQPRLVLLGVCQPTSCSVNDTRTMITAWTSATHNSSSTSLTVLGVRQVPGSLSALADPRLQAICGVLLLVLCIVGASSLYEYFYIKKRNPEAVKECLGENNNGFQSDKVDEEKERPIQTIHMKQYDKPEAPKVENLESARPSKKGSVSAAFLAFSAISNGNQILSLQQQSDVSINSIHGLRVISLTWVILVHTYLQFFAIGGNKTIREVTERTFMFQTIGNATFSVDTFFFISGLLLAYLYTKKQTANKKQSALSATMEFMMLLFYRLLRLTPLYILVIGFVQQAMQYVRNDSVFEIHILDDRNCESYWWRNILYINNFYPRTEMCMLWSWYLAADTQFFALGIILLILSKRKLKMAAGILGAILLTAWSTTAFVSYTNQYQAKVSAPFDLFDELYDKPWTRIGPYVAGMAAGWFLQVKGKTLIIPNSIVLAGWVACGAVLVSLVYGLGSGLGVAVSAIYASLGHTAWGLCLAWIVIACETRNGGIINGILACRIWYPLSRLTFCAYLVHPVIMVLTSFVMDGSFHIHNGLIVILFLGNTVAAFLTALLLSLGFEVPIVRLQKLAMKLH